MKGITFRVCSILYVCMDTLPLFVCGWPSGSGCRKPSVWFFWERTCRRYLDGSPCAEEQHGVVVFLSSERPGTSGQRPPHGASWNWPHCPTPQNPRPHHHSNNRCPMKTQWRDSVTVYLKVIFTIALQNFLI